MIQLLFLFVFLPSFGQGEIKFKFPSGMPPRPEGLGDRPPPGFRPPPMPTGFGGPPLGGVPRGMGAEDDPGYGPYKKPKFHRSKDVYNIDENFRPEPRSFKEIYKKGGHQMNYGEESDQGHRLYKTSPLDDGIYEALRNKKQYGEDTEEILAEDEEEEEQDPNKPRIVKSNTRSYTKTEDFNWNDEF